MKSSPRKKRTSRRTGPIHFLQGLFLEALGFAALVFTLLGLGNENWLISWISSPSNETQPLEIDSVPPGFVPQVFEMWKEDTTSISDATNSQQPLVTRPGSTWTSNPASQTAQSAWQPGAPRDPYLGHNTPWTSRH